MRTIKRVSYPLNQGKYEAIREIASAYAREKQEHLPVYWDDALFGSHRNERTLRDELVKAGYVSPHGVSGRMWKLAQKDAYETVKKQWAALAETIRPLVGVHKANNPENRSVVWADSQMRCAYWLLSDPRRLAGLMAGQAIIPQHFKIEAGQRKIVRNYLQRVIRRKRGSGPVVKLERSFTLDPDMYDIRTTTAGTQVIAITGLVPRKRIRIPLTGQTIISGNIRVVLDPDKQRVEIHYTAKLKRGKSPSGLHAPTSASTTQDKNGRNPSDDRVAAVDAGLSEVFTDEAGNRYGTGLGRLLYEESDRILARNRKRNKLYQLAEKHSRQGRRKKAEHIRKFNLGRKKQTTQRRRNRIELERQINTALNELIRERKPSVLVTEKLDIRGKAKSKQLSRQVSLWPRGILQARTDFKASAVGCCREQVNPAYTSQMCPQCWFVNGKNRNGDRFKCLNCGYEQGADRVAAMNLKARRTDPDITLWTPKERVKIILLDRFAASHDAQHGEVAACRLETAKPEECTVRTDNGGAGTVTGRTPVATIAAPNGTLSTESETTSAMPIG